MGRGLSMVLTALTWFHWYQRSPCGPRVVSGGRINFAGLFKPGSKAQLESARLARQELPPSARSSWKHAGPVAAAHRSPT